MDAVYDLSVSSDAGLLQQLSEVLSDEGISLEVLKYAVSCAGSLPSVSSEELTGVVEMVKNTGVQNTILLLFKFLEEAKLKASWLCARNEDLKDKLGKQVEEIAADHVSGRQCYTRQCLFLCLTRTDKSLSVLLFSRS